MNQATKSKKTARFVAATLSAALLLSSAALANVNYVSADEGEPLFVSDYSSKAEAVQAGLDLNLQIAEEGMILVKNENGALPLVTGKGTAGAKITVFGYAGIFDNLVKRPRRTFVRFFLPRRAKHIHNARIDLLKCGING